MLGEKCTNKENKDKIRVPRHTTFFPAFCVLMVLLFWMPAASCANRNPAVDPVLRELLRKAANDTDSFHDRFDAEVWLADMSQRLKSRIPDDAFRIKLLKIVHYEAIRAGLKPELVLSVIQVESNFNPYAISVSGARGLMQVMPFWLGEIGKPGDNLFRVQTNLRYGCTILKYYLEQENGNSVRALARYNGSPGNNQYAARVYEAFQTNWRPQ